jgi:hypothetical protein
LPRRRVTGSSLVGQRCGGAARTANGVRAAFVPTIDDQAAGFGDSRAVEAIVSQSAQRPRTRVRALNDLIASGLATSSGEQEAFFCECARVDCWSVVWMTLAEYRELRDAPGSFTLAADHWQPELERIITDSARFLVVEPAERLIRIAQSLDGLPARAH